ncbi:MAG: hypothetical protein R2838_07065 [Caldilineaceae bacterium]
MNYVNFLRSERRLPEMSADAVEFSYELVVTRRSTTWRRGRHGVATLRRRR